MPASTATAATTKTISTTGAPLSSSAVVLPDVDDGGSAGVAGGVSSVGSVVEKTLFSVYSAWI